MTDTTRLQASYDAIGYIARYSAGQCYWTSGPSLVWYRHELRFKASYAIAGVVQPDCLPL